MQLGWSWCLFWRMSAFRRATGGVAAVEFALVLPVLTLIMFGLYEMSQFIYAKGRVNRVAYVMGDLVSRDFYTQSEVQGIMQAAPSLMDPFDFSQGRGAVMISGIADRGDGSGVRVTWQERVGDPSRVSSLGGIGAAVQLPADIPMAAMQALIGVEVFYTFSPLFEGLFGSVFTPSSREFSALYYIRPRRGGMVDFKKPH